MKLGSKILRVLFKNNSCVPSAIWNGTRICQFLKDKSLNVVLSLLFFFLSVQNYFSNALITDQFKQRKFQLFCCRRFAYLILISIDFDDFTSPFTTYFLFR